MPYAMGWTPGNVAEATVNHSTRSAQPAGHADGAPPSRGLEPHPPAPLRGAAAKAAGLVVRWRDALLEAARLGPVLDVACGDGRNGMYLAAHGARVLLVDASEAAQESLRAAGWPERVHFSRMDLETPVPPAFDPEGFGAVLVFRYLHRPLIPVLRGCLAPGGLLVYETYLEGQEAHGKPRNPEHLLRRGELAAWFGDWEVLEHFEGDLDDPSRVMGRMVCRKPAVVASEPAP